MPVQGGFAMVIPPTAPDARRLLVQFALWLPRAGLEADAGDALQIVLAEAVNNIVEHGGCNGKETISVRIFPVGRGRFRIDIRDCGRKIPKAALAGFAASLPCDANRQVDALSEDGFGWQLISALACHVHYECDRNGNRLCLVLETRPETRSGARHQRATRSP